MTRILVDIHIPNSGHKLYEKELEFVAQRTMDISKALLEKNNILPLTKGEIMDRLSTGLARRRFVHFWNCSAFEKLLVGLNKARATVGENVDIGTLNIVFNLPEGEFQEFLDIVFSTKETAIKQKISSLAQVKDEKERGKRKCQNI